MKRDTAQTIFRTVVFAGAWLGAPACGKQRAPVTPANTATDTGKSGDPAMMKDGDKPAAGADPCAADPCARPRGTDDDGGGGAGRGFILS